MRRSSCTECRGSFWDVTSRGAVNISAAGGKYSAAQRGLSPRGTTRRATSADRGLEAAQSDIVVTWQAYATLCDRWPSARQEVTSRNGPAMKSRSEKLRQNRREAVPLPLALFRSVLVLFAAGGNRCGDYFAAAGGKPPVLGRKRRGVESARGRRLHDRHSGSSRVAGSE
jgi:hypothetical protein